MRCVGRKLLTAAIFALLVVAGGCSSSDEDQAVDPNLRGGNAAAGFPMEQALVACIQDNGIDAELLPNGAVLSDKNGTLSREESHELSDLCFQRLEDQGFIVHEESNDELTQSDYAALAAFRECLIDHGIAIPELASFESLAGNPELGNVFGSVAREDPLAFEEAYANCPYQ